MVHSDLLKVYGHRYKSYFSISLTQIVSYFRYIVKMVVRSIIKDQCFLAFDIDATKSKYVGWGYFEPTF